MATLIDQRNLFVVTDLPALVEIRDSLFPSLSKLTNPVLGFNIKVDTPDGVKEVRTVITSTGVSGMNQEDNDDVFCLEGDLVRNSEIRIKGDIANDAIHVVVRCDLENNEHSAMFSIIEGAP